MPVVFIYLRANEVEAAFGTISPPLPKGGEGGSFPTYHPGSTRKPHFFRNAVYFLPAMYYNMMYKGECTLFEKSPGEKGEKNTA